MLKMENKLIALINFWDGEEILPYTIKNIEPLVDEVLIVYSNTSNYGSFKNNDEFLKQFLNKKISAFKHEPYSNLKPVENERMKRNTALRIAKERGHDYFIMLDADEIYESEPFLKEYERIQRANLNGLVCATQVYFGSPQLTIGLDTTRVPFIHKLKPYTKFQFNKEYPFAFDAGIRIDPTRQLNYVHGIGWSDIIMHHYSWTRNNYFSKIRNSTARHNIEKSNVLTELSQAKAGYYCNFYRKTLVPATVDFGICLNYSTSSSGKKPIQSKPTPQEKANT